VVQRHGAIYAREFGWDETFEALVARVIADYAAGHDPRREAAWIAEVDGAPVGCVMCVRRDETTAQLRLLLVEPAARGMGVGGRLVEECLRFARRAGYERIMLWTYDATVDAHRIYERMGFTLDEEKKARAFGHDMVEETWSRELRERSERRPAESRELRERSERRPGQREPGERQPAEPPEL
jgi:GNAT superfamily N-acetyltransferase